MNELLESNSRRDKLYSIFHEFACKHQKILYLKRRQLLINDEYGLTDRKKWEKAVTNFVDNVFFYDNEIRANVENLLIFHTTFQQWRYDLYDAVDTILDGLDNDLYEHNPDEIERLEPIHFEKYCAQLLISSGWNARLTKGSGDQGIDIIASYGNKKAVFQCKKYSKPVGNHAIQEIFTGKQFEQADIAAVVTNNLYTPSAKQIASSTGVYLLHYSELPDFSHKLGISSGNLE